MKNRAFVKYKKTGEIVPGSLIITQGGYPKGGPYKEITMDLCCDTNPCTPTDYTPWKIVTGGVAGDGVVLIDDSDGGCETYTFIGPNDAEGNGWVYLTQYYETETCLKIDYEWTSFDDNNVDSPPTYDRPIYWTSDDEPTGIPDDIIAKVGGTPDDGTWNIIVSAGQWFSIGIYSSDSCCGRGFLQVEICEEPCPTTTSTTSSTTTTTTEEPTTTTTTEPI